MMVVIRVKIKRLRIVKVRVMMLTQRKSRMKKRLIRERVRLLVICLKHQSMELIHMSI